MLSPKTLEVLCIYDWEHAGFFPQVFEEPMWRLQHEEYIKLFGDIDKIQELVSNLPYQFHRIPSRLI
jgi:hypothetical protein